MLTWIVLALCGVAAIFCVATHKKYLYKKAEKVFGYFEYEYDGEVSTSRDYGPMLEIDMVGAMRHRQECGAHITFSHFGTEDEIFDIIDKREYLRQQQKTRRKF
ncbi:hypothetical protein [Salmonella phage SSBI34]|nr:hypothetical protein [Salmonella phage SSBI34]